MKKTRNRSQPEAKYLSVRCPGCQTIWRCYGMREKSFYKCVRCGRRFELPDGNADDHKAKDVRNKRRQTFTRLVSRLDNATRI
ncbi:MAG: hypothetical protein AB7P14_23200 [Blastocatellales bacterium]